VEGREWRMLKDTPTNALGRYCQLPRTHVWLGVGSGESVDLSLVSSVCSSCSKSSSGSLLAAGSEVLPMTGSWI
jgi:hypothetical protein